MCSTLPATTLESTFFRCVINRPRFVLGCALPEGGLAHRRIPALNQYLTDLPEFSRMLDRRYFPGQPRLAVNLRQLQANIPERTLSFRLTGHWTMLAAVD